MRRFARDNGLSLFFLVIFLATVAAQSFAGQHAENADLAEHGSQAVSWSTYVLSPSFGGALMENWQSEFLQFSLFIAATIWLVQKGSNESSSLDEIGTESDRQQLIGALYAARAGLRLARRNDLRTRVYENSLLIVMTSDLLRDMVRPVAQQLARLQRGSGLARAAPRRVEPAISSMPTSGRRPSRTGSRSSSPSALWWCSRSTFDSGARPNRSRSEHLTRRPASIRASPAVEDRS